MVEVELSKIKIDESRNEQLIVFKEKGGTRFLPLVIGISEVQAIKLKLSGVKPPRPLTHDLFFRTLQALNVTIEKVCIDRLQSNTFFAKLILKTKDGESVEVDARPSDAVALAIRGNTPVFVAEEVLGQAGVTSL
ncbi:MAG: bifunctional nuclease family protein [Candidatus Omnitrophica bacterium]|nr:bifunctional nuclease family protein [Candidatus Omnitrophota bacterium]